MEAYEVEPQSLNERASHQEQEPEAKERSRELWNFIEHVEKPIVEWLRTRAAVNAIERGGRQGEVSGVPI